MKTYKRIEKLRQAVDFVSVNFDKSVIVADIGTDHGYLAETLSKSEKYSEILATDISEKSLNKLKNLIKSRQLQKIKMFVGDGLKPIKNADIAVIAGVGGHEIIKILESQNIDEKGNAKCNIFVLQPAQNEVQLREWIFKNHIKLIKDYVIFDAERFYPIIIVDISKKQRNKMNTYNLWVGRDNSLDDEDFVLFLNNLKTSLLFVDGISKSRAKKDKILYHKYKLKRIVEKLLKV